MDTLYHYTTIDAFLNMLKDENEIHFWATRYDYLNDGEEFRKGIELLNKFIPEIEQEFKIEGDKKISDYIQNLGKELEYYYKVGNAGFYVTSLSEKSDDLPMWRMYGSDCNGIAIGLDFQTIYKAFDITETIGQEKLRKVFYEGQEHIEKEIRKIYELWQTLDIQDGKELLNEYANAVNLLCIYIKSRYFEYEKEWRIALYDWDIKPDDIKLTKWNKPTKFRIKDGVIIPYKKITLTVDAIKSITLGPTYNIDRSKDSLEMFLKSKKIDVNKVIIRKSGVSYIK